MALTYYIRSWDPRSTYPANPQEGDICYTITLDQTWAPVGGVKKDNIVKEEIYQNGAWVEQGGGGGGSGLDVPLFSAKMTIEGTPPAPVFSDFTCTATYAELSAIMDDNHDNYPGALKTETYFGGELVSTGYSPLSIYAEGSEYTEIFATDNSAFTVKMVSDGTITFVSE